MAKGRHGFVVSGRMDGLTQPLGVGNRVVIMLMIDHKMTRIVLMSISVHVVRVEDSGQRRRMLNMITMLFIRNVKWPNMSMRRNEAVKFNFLPPV